MEATTPTKNEGQPHKVERAAYTTSEAAQALGVTEATIYRLITRRQLRAVPGIRHKRILVSELERFAGGEINKAA
jgi:excisionase family DNA binding protein